MIGLAELLPDGSQPSTIGNEYGDIYENQFDMAKASPLNNEGKAEVRNFFQTHMKPVMNIGKSIAKL